MTVNPPPPPAHRVGNAELRRWTSIKPTCKYQVLLNTVPMLVQRLQRWTVIETALGDCPVFAWTAMWVTLFASHRQKSHYLDNTIHWLNANVMLGHRL